MHLSQSEIQSHAWEKIKKHYEERLNILRAKNDGHLSEIDTAFLRGQITECKLVLSLEPKG